MGVLPGQAGLAQGAQGAASLRSQVGRLARGAISAVYLRTLRGRWQSFVRAAEQPERSQLERLRQLLRDGAGTAFGREHGFAGIGDLEAFRRRVPLRDYEAFAPWIQRVADGEPGVLTARPVRVMEHSSGSTSTNKLIPYTDALLEEFSAATGPWIYDLHRSFAGLQGTRSYWSVSPVVRQQERTAGGIPIGFEDDTEYFGPLQRWALGQLMAVPAAVARIPEMDRWREATCRHLVAARDLGLISVWSPTFLCLLMEHIERTLGSRPALGQTLWPRLRVISCWADGSSAHFVGRLRRWFPTTPIQPKGLLATEGVVSFPVGDGEAGSVLAVSGHFLEFLDVEHLHGPPLSAHQLRQGGCYTPLLTTGGGLYRYHLKDVVRCVGRFRATPLVRFAGKLDAVSDLCGEKLNARHVEQALERCGLERRFAIVAPTAGQPPRYTLYYDGDADDRALEGALQRIDEYLCSIHHYRYCRQLGQLGPPHVARVEDGWQRYQATLVARGVRVGDIKPTALDLKGAAAEAFAAATEETR